MASLWIIWCCYSWGASCSTPPWAMCKSWMTVKKANDKLMDFSGSARKHSEASYRDVHNVYLATFATSSGAHYCLVCLFGEPVRVTDELQKRGALLFCHALSDWLSTCFQWGGSGISKKAIISLELFLFLVFTSKSTTTQWCVATALWDVHRYMYTHTSLQKHVKAPTECSTEDHCDIYISGSCNAPCSNTLVAFLLYVLTPGKKTHTCAHYNLTFLSKTPTERSGFAMNLQACALISCLLFALL